MAFEDVLNRHNNCSVVIIPRYHKNRPQLVPGLYCENHGKLIKWIRNEQINELKELGVEVLEPIKIDKLKVMREQLRRGMR
jgi:hypothetical protein